MNTKKPITPVIVERHYERLKEHVDANAKRHPAYGPCDGMGEGGSCSVCDMLLDALRDAIQSQRGTVPDTAKWFVTDEPLEAEKYTF